MTIWAMRITVKITLIKLTPIWIRIMMKVKILMKEMAKMEKLTNTLMMLVI